jgi:hypothetical protein
MKALILLVQKHKVLIIVVMFILMAIAVAIGVVDKRGEQQTMALPESSEQKAKMDKFKSGTFKPAKEIGY